MESIFLVVIILAFGLMMWWQSKKAKQQRNELQDFRNNLEPGTEVITIGGVIGKVVSVDTKYEEIVIDSEGSQLRFKFSAVSKTYTRPAFIDDDEDADATTDSTVAQVSAGIDDGNVNTDAVESQPAQQQYDTTVPVTDADADAQTSSTTHHDEGNAANAAER